MKSYLYLFVMLISLSWRLEAQTLPDNDLEEEAGSEDLDESDREEVLEFSQIELHQAFKSGFSFNLGSVLPWSKIGASMYWQSGEWINSFSLGFGSFSFSGNLDRRNYLVSGKNQVIALASRHFLFGIGPIYFEPNIGLMRWDGDIKPRGNDALSDVAASSLTSRFEAMGLNLAINVGLMWFFKNGIFLDYSLVQLSKAIILKEDFTSPTEDARQAVRKQVGGLISMSSLNLRLGYALNF